MKKAKRCLLCCSQASHACVRGSKMDKSHVKYQRLTCFSWFSHNTSRQNLFLSKMTAIKVIRFKLWCWNRHILFTCFPFYQHQCWCKTFRLERRGKSYSASRHVEIARRRTPDVEEGDGGVTWGFKMLQKKKIMGVPRH